MLTAKLHEAKARHSQTKFAFHGPNILLDTSNPEFGGGGSTSTSKAISNIPSPIRRARCQIVGEGLRLRRRLRKSWCFDLTARGGWTSSTDNTACSVSYPPCESASGMSYSRSDGILGAPLHYNLPHLLFVLLLR